MTGFLWYAYLNTVVPPMNNVHCRMAIEYAANKTNLQTAYGGPYAGGAIASTVSPPNVVGHKNFDLYDAISKPQGDVAAAKNQLKLCGQPNGFSTGIAYRSDRPKEVAAATALQQVLLLHHRRRHHRPDGQLQRLGAERPVVNNLLAKYATTTDDATRNSYTGQVDMQVMKNAAILPEVYAKSLLYRSPQLTNVFVQAYYGMYNYSELGLK